jgi:hypothetical protein
MVHAYTLRILLAQGSDLCRPPEMTRQVHRATLIGLLEQFATMQCTLGNQSIVIFFAKVPCRVKTTGNDADGLELRSGVADGFFVNCKRLCEVFVGDFFKPILVCNLPASDEKAEGEVCGAGDAGVQG